jgi:hypothetical protein
VDTFKYRCPVHGLIVSHRRSDPNPPPIPKKCPLKADEDSEPCGETLRFEIVAYGALLPSRWT